MSFVENVIKTTLKRLSDPVCGTTVRWGNPMRELTCVLPAWHRGECPIYAAKAELEEMEQLV